MARETIHIDMRLRFLFFGLECAVGELFRVQEMERVFADAKTDHVSQKEYTFYSAGRLRITGLVEEYEPETLILSVEGDKKLEKALPEIVKNAGYHYIRWSSEDTLLNSDRSSETS